MGLGDAVTPDTRKVASRETQAAEKCIFRDL
jgi:hypothetical protein